MQRRGLARNEHFFSKAGDAKSNPEEKVKRAFQRCAQSGFLNLSEQGLEGELPASVCNFADADWAENWWDQYPVTKVDVSHNSLTSIPTDIGKLVECCNFLAASNQLREVPGQLFSELPLKQLNLRNNLLSTLPSEVICKARCLVELVLGGNRLVQLPVEIVRLETLEVLDLNGNQFCSVPPPQHWKCSRLLRLDVSGNRLAPCLPDLRASCPLLRELLAAGNRLEDVGELLVCGDGQCGWRTCLVSVDLSKNVLGPYIRVQALEVLNSLDLTSNRLSHLDFVGPFPRLSTVLASMNKIREFPRALLSVDAPSLATLDFSNNELNTLPPELGLTQTLKRVAFEGNPLRAISRELLSGGAEKLKTYLRSRIVGLEEVDAAADAADDLAVELRTAAARHELILEDRSLVELPELPEGLRILQVQGNHLASASLCRSLGLVGKSVAASPNIAGLRELRAARNVLKDDPALIPRLLLGLGELQDLDLSMSQISSCGDESAWTYVTSMSKIAHPLRLIDLSSNSLCKFPVQVLVFCQRLVEMRLRQNRITSLEPLSLLSRQNGCNLSTLVLEQNLLRDVPPWLPSVFPCLHTLLLANNDIGPSLPPELGFWNSLQTISVVGNPLKGLRQIVLTKGWPAIAACLRDRLPSGASSSVVASVVDSFGTPGDRVPSPVPTMPKQLAVSEPVVYSRPASAPVLDDDRLERLRSEAKALESELSTPGISRARQSTITHSLRLKRAELVKIEREVQRQRDIEAAVQ